MSKCRYNLERDCHNKDCVDCVLENIKAELNELKLHYVPSSGVEWGIKMCLEIIDNHISGKRRE